VGIEVGFGSESEVLREEGSGAGPYEAGVAGGTLGSVPSVRVSAGDTIYSGSGAWRRQRPAAEGHFGSRARLADEFKLGEYVRCGERVLKGVGKRGS